MNKLYLGAVLTVATLFGTSRHMSANPHVNLGKPGYARMTEIYRAAAMSSEDDDMDDEEENLHTVVLDVDYDLDIDCELNGLFAFESTGTDVSFYYGLSEDEDSHVYEFQMPDGTYDFYVGAVLGWYEGMMMLTIDGVEVKEDINLSLSASSATTRTEIRHIGPDGDEVRPIYGPLPGTSPNVQYIQSLSHSGQLVLTNSLSTDSQYLTYVITNNPDSRYSLTRLDLMCTPQGFLNMIIPIDFSKQVNSTDSDNWQMGEASFALTPANEIYNNYVETSGNGSLGYSFSSSVLIYDGKSNGLPGIGAYDSQCRSDLVGVWVPAGYSGPYDMMPIPSGAAINGWSSSTCAFPLKRSPEGLRQVPLTLPPNRSIFLADGESPLIGKGYSLFGDVPTTATLGGCTPMLMLIPEEEYFEFFYTGRHGETINQASDYYTLPSPEYWEEIFSEPLCELEFKRNGEIICTNRNDFPYDTEWEEVKVDENGDLEFIAGEFELTITNRNVEIDGTPGFSMASHFFNTNNGSWIPPTMTSLSIIDASGTINDKLGTIVGAKVVFSAGHFEYASDWTNQYDYAAFEPVECMSVEYAPRGTDEFIALEAEEIGEPVLPGFGNVFEAKLDTQKETINKGWYDLRITVRDSYDGKQTQTISPAFYVDSNSVSGIVSLDSDTEGNVEIYTVDGVRVSSPNARGIYIVKTANGTSKIIR